MKGLPWMKIATDFTLDQKWRRLERRLSLLDYYAAVGLWVAVLADGCREGDREAGVVDVDAPEGIVQALQSVGLLDVDRRIPEGPWNKWAGEALAKTQTFRVLQAEKGRKGGAARADAPRDDKGRIQAVPTPAAGSLHTGPSPRRGPVQTDGVDPPTLEGEREGEEKEREKDRSGRTPSPPRAPAREVTLTRLQMEAWRTFTDPIWIPVRDAWLAKGLRMPPPGPPPEDAPDDPDTDTSPRSRLWRMIDQDPGNAAMVAGWIRESPSTKAGDVLQFVFSRAEERRSRIAQEAAREEAAAKVNGRTAGSLESVADVLGRIR